MPIQTYISVTYRTQKAELESEAQTVVRRGGG